MTLAFIAVIFGLALLVWSADRFVEGSAATARHFGMPPLLIGMVVVGFGTSTPEMGRVTVERKTPRNFLLSVIDLRLFTQVAD